LIIKTDKIYVVSHLKPLQYISLYQQLINPVSSAFLPFLQKEPSLSWDQILLSVAQTLLFFLIWMFTSNKIIYYLSR